MDRTSINTINEITTDIIREENKLTNVREIDQFASTSSVSYIGISKRLKEIKWPYFEAIYQTLVHKLSSDLGATKERTLHRFDSTIINLSGCFIKNGLIIVGKALDSPIKVSVGLRQQLPTSIRFCTLQEESSEDLALVRAIHEARVDHEDILERVFTVKRVCLKGS